MYFCFISACSVSFFFFFNDTATTEIYTLSLHDALPIFIPGSQATSSQRPWVSFTCRPGAVAAGSRVIRLMSSWAAARTRSEEHTSELQSRQYLVCRLLLEKKKKIQSCQG